jgi:hypothetical protein
VPEGPAAVFGSEAFEVVPSPFGELDASMFVAGEVESAVGDAVVDVVAAVVAFAVDVIPAVGVEAGLGALPLLSPGPA